MTERHGGQHNGQHDERHGRQHDGRHDGRQNRAEGPPRWQLRVVRGRSMRPTLSDGDRLLVRRADPGDAAPRPGALVVVRLPGGRPESVKRLLRRDPEGWWVERDNPAEGVDSWQVGAIPPADLIGVAVARLWPRPRLLR